MIQQLENRVKGDTNRCAQVANLVSRGEAIRFEWENGAMFEHDQWVCLFRCFTSEFWMLDVFLGLFHYVTVISIGARTT